MRFCPAKLASALIISMAPNALSAESVDWGRQAEEDARQDFSTIIFDGQAPNQLACDTTVRPMPDGSWVTVMLGGGHTEPLPANRVFISRSQDQGKSWTPMCPIDLGIKSKDPSRAITLSELMLNGKRATMVLQVHNGGFGEWKTYFVHSDDSCHTWSELEPAPGKLADRTMIRNAIKTRDGRILMPYQHYNRCDETGRKISKGRVLYTPRDPRTGVIESHDGGRTWELHGDIRLTADDDYHGWAEPNIVELSDGTIAMIIRADRLGGVLYYAESKDGGRTWPELARKTTIPNPGSKATLYGLGGDTVAILHNPNPRHRSPLALWVSFDGMKTWPYRRVLVPESCDKGGRINYPDGFVSEDGEFLNFAFDDNRHHCVFYRAKLPPLPSPTGVRSARKILFLGNSITRHALLLSASVPAGQAQDMRRRKKLIATGWDKVDSQRLLDNLELMEKRPFDGVVIGIIGRTGDDKPCHLRAAFHNQPWQAEWFEASVDRLNQCRFHRFTDNFITVGANPGNVDWFDDAGWKVIVDHWRVAASVAKRSGFKGILFDSEPYTPPHAQFRYEAQAGHDEHTFDEYCVKARERGREVMQAIVEEYPDITLFCYFMNSVNSTTTGHADPRVALAPLGYGLYPAFIDGWLDVAPPDVVLVDGCESAYRYNSQQQYLEAAVRIKGACQELVAPENRARYRAQVQVSFGVYLDAYWNPKDSKYGAWYIDGLGGPRVERLQANVHTALRVADEYVWIYGEKFRWWPTPNDRVKEESWPEALPGCEDALRFVCDPIDYARTKIAAQRTAGTLASAARNGDFSSETATSLEGAPATWKEGRPPAGWSSWQEAKSEGVFTWDRQSGAGAPGAARACGVSGGCFLQSYRVEPGQRWAVRAVRKIAGRGQAWIRVRWQTPEGHWTLEGLDQLIFCPGKRHDWSELFGVVEVPDGVGRMVILLGAGGQKSSDDIVWYDDVELYELK